MVVPPPPYVIVPLPWAAKVNASVCALNVALTVREGKVPVAPAKVPVPPVTVAVTVVLAFGVPARMNANGTGTLAVIVPLDNVNVIGTFRFGEVRLLAVTEMLAVKVPLPMPVNENGPVAVAVILVMLDKLMVPEPFKFTDVFTVVCAPAQTAKTTPKAIVFFIGL